MGKKGGVAKHFLKNLQKASRQRTPILARRGSESSRLAPKSLQNRQNFCGQTTRSILEYFQENRQEQKKSKIVYPAKKKTKRPLNRSTSRATRKRLTGLSKRFLTPPIASEALPIQAQPGGASEPLSLEQPPKQLPVPASEQASEQPQAQLLQQQLAFSGFAPLTLSTQDVLNPGDTLRKSIEAFLLDQRSPHTRRAYGKDLKRFVKFLILRKHDQGVENLNRMVLIAYKEFLVSEKLEHTTIDRHLATLKSFFKWLVEDGLILKSPADGVRFLNPKRLSTTQGFSDEEVKKVLAQPDLHTRTGSLHYAILMVLFYCGLRRSEVCGLQTKNIGTERNQPVLRLRGKGNAERLIVMIKPVWNAVRYYLYIVNRTLEKDETLFQPLRNNRTGLLKKPLDPSMIFYIVRKYAKLAGIANRVSPHSCRATAISNARDHHVPDRAIQEFAGWASPDMITRYDKRRTSVEESAAHAIFYGAENRSVPSVPDPGQSHLFDPSQPVPSEASELAESQKNDLKPSDPPPNPSPNSPSNSPTDQNQTKL